MKEGESMINNCGRRKSDVTNTRKKKEDYFFKKIKCLTRAFTCSSNMNTLKMPHRQKMAQDVSIQSSRGDQ